MGRPEAQMTTVLAGAADWVRGVSFEQVPDQAVHAAKRSMLDLLGVSVAGTQHELAANLQRYLEITTRSGNDSATLIGLDSRASIEQAAMYNAVLGHVLDFDDSSDTLLGHPSVMILPALLAIAEERQLDGRAVLTAYAAGVEVAAHLAKQVHVAHYERGWHPTPTLGIFGTAAASAKLLGLSGEETLNALAIASAFPSGTRSSFGTHMKSVQVGDAARRGLSAALLASTGVEGNPAAFEDPQGFGVAYNGGDGFRATPFDASPGRTWDLIEPGLTIKRYPCCASAHSAVDAVLDLRRGLGGDDTVESMHVKLHPRRLRHTDKPMPATPLEAKFSVQYAVAAALASGSLSLADFTEAAIHGPAVRALLQRTKAEPLQPEKYGPDHYAAEVEIRLVDGSVRSRRVEKARGRGTELALTDDEIAAKFQACVRPVFGGEVAEAAIAGIMSLESATSIGSLMQLLTPSPPVRP